MVIARVRLAHLEAVEYLPASPRTAPPLVLIHGLGGGVWGWENFQRHFAQRGYRSVALELPGHDLDPTRRSVQVGAISVETFALYAAAALAELEPAVVIGHSMGGLIAQKLAETMPQRGYVFLASAPPWHMVRRAYWPMWKRLLRHPWREIVRPALQQPMLLDRRIADELVNQRLTAEQRARIYELDVPDSGRASLQMAAGLVAIDQARITTPRLVIGGAADRLIPACETERLAAFHSAPLRMFDNGHMLMVEAGWEQVADTILEWAEESCQLSVASGQLGA